MSVSIVTKFLISILYIALSFDDVIAVEAGIVATDATTIRVAINTKQNVRFLRRKTIKHRMVEEISGVNEGTLDESTMPQEGVDNEEGDIGSEEGNDEETNYESQEGGESGTNYNAQEVSNVARDEGTNYESQEGIDGEGDGGTNYEPQQQGTEEETNTKAQLESEEETNDVSDEGPDVETKDESQEGAYEGENDEAANDESQEGDMETNDESQDGADLETNDESHEQGDVDESDESQEGTDSEENDESQEGTDAEENDESQEGTEQEDDDESQEDGAEIDTTNTDDQDVGDEYDEKLAEMSSSSSSSTKLSPDELETTVATTEIDQEKDATADHDDQYFDVKTTPSGDSTDNTSIDNETFDGDAPVSSSTDWTIAKNATLNAPFGLGIGPVILNGTLPVSAAEANEAGEYGEGYEGGDNVDQEDTTGATKSMAATNNEYPEGQDENQSMPGQLNSLDSDEGGEDEEQAVPTTKTIKAGVHGYDEVGPSANEIGGEHLSGEEETSPTSTLGDRSKVSSTVAEEVEDQALVGEFPSLGVSGQTPTSSNPNSYYDATTEQQGGASDKQSFGQYDNSIPGDASDHYSPPSDENDPLVQEEEVEQEKQQEKGGTTDATPSFNWKEKTPAEMAALAEEEAKNMAADKYVKLIISVASILSIGLMLLVAQQLVENPNGGCSKFCRCMIGCVRCIIVPFRMVLCCELCNKRARDRRTHSVISRHDDDLEFTL
jgi:hypothetical protein